MISEIIKRDGSVQEFDPDKMLHWAKWAAVVGVDWFAVVADAYKKCPDRATTAELQASLIQACLDHEDTPHLLMAGRLLMGDVYKQAYGGHENIPSVKAMYHSMNEKGLWDNMGYSDEDLDEAESIICHQRDLETIHSQVSQCINKYAGKNIETGRILESPAFVWMRMALGVCQDEPKATRMAEVKAYYDDLAQGLINAPTPNMLNLGTRNRSFASCAVFKSNDNLKSLAVGDHIAYTMTGASAGVGAMLMTRSKGDGVRRKTIKHMGKLPYYNASSAAVHANTQAGRGGALTMHFSCLDPEVMTLLRLRHPTTVAEMKVDGIDYSFGFHPLLAEKAANREDWMLVSLKDAPALYAALYSGSGKFEEEYAKYENSKGKRTYISAFDLAHEFLRMQQETGRMYEHNIFEMNYHTPFKEPIYSSNLCQEVFLATEGYVSVADLHKEDDDITGELALCNLGAVVAGRVTPEMYPDVAYRTLKMVDTVISLMDYPFPHLKHTAQARRSAGVGITNLAHDLASKGLSYTSAEGKAYMHRLAEMHSFWLHKASVRLAKERGRCEWFHKTKYADGWLPIDTYAKHVDNITPQELLCDWEGLRKEIAEFGMRNSVLEAFMPVESSSLASNTTNSLYPIREFVTIKGDGSKKVVFIAPELDSLRDKYELAWNIPTRDLTEMYAIFQKFCGQGISADYYQSFVGERKVSLRELMQDWFYRIRCGLKSRYYTNSAAGLKLEEVCESCKL